MLGLDNFEMHEKLKKQLRAKGIESLFQIQVREHSGRAR
jgi:hypothetical protein